MVFSLLRVLAFSLSLFPLFYWAHAASGSSVSILDPCFLDYTVLPVFLRLCCLGLGILSLLSYAFLMPSRSSPWLYFGTLLGISSLLLLAIENTTHFYVLLLQGDIYQAPWAPFALGLCFSFGIFMGILLYNAKNRIGSFWTREKYWQFIPMLGFLILCIIAIPFFQMLTFGRTDERGTADAIVVFGTRTYADGRPSLTLASRMQTACELYQQEKTPLLIVSGGPGDGAVHETDAMKEAALHCGISASSIIQDREGWSTQATVHNTMVLFRKFHLTRILAVSDFSHLVRIKMMYAAAGQEIGTVPAQGLRPPSLLFYQVRREIAILLSCYLRGF